MLGGEVIMEMRRGLSWPVIFSIANRAEDVETLNAILARLRQRFHTKRSREIYERVNAAYQAGNSGSLALRGCGS